MSAALLVAVGGAALYVALRVAAPAVAPAERRDHRRGRRYAIRLAVAGVAVAALPPTWVGVATAVLLAGTLVAAVAAVVVAGFALHVGHVAGKAQRDRGPARDLEAIARQG